MTKAYIYKFAKPFHGPYQIIEQSDTGVVVRPIDKPQAEPIRVAYNRGVTNSPKGCTDFEICRTYSDFKRFL